jgi:hypothetical protein
MDVSSPLTDEHFQEMRKQLANLDEADAQIRKAIQAGIDMSAQQKQTAEMRTQLMKIAQAYFPGKSLR